MGIGTTWAGTYTFGAAALHTPSTLEEAQRLVAERPRIRALGSGHSFHDLADSPGDLVSLAGVPIPVEVAADGASAWVGGSQTYGEVALALDAAGLAVPAMASLPHISVAGAISTATHGSGDRTPCLSGVVTGIDLIGHDGELRRLERGDPDFPGAVVALGALGVVTRVRLAVEPRYEIRQDVVNAVPFPTLLERFDEITAAAYSVSIFTRWGDAVEQVWFKSRGEDGPAELFGGTLATTHQHPILGLDPVNATAQMGVRGPWHDRLPHFRMGFTPSNGTEIQSEYLVPREQAVAALRAVAPLAERVAPLLQVTEIRTIAADDLWLSAAYGRDTVGLHFTFERDPEGVRALLPALEDALLPLGARPHWGKWFTADRDAIQRAYPRLDDFRDLAARMDPDGKFRNAYLDRLVL